MKDQMNYSEYLVRYQTWYGENETKVLATSKTDARQAFKGEYNTNCKIISITKAE